LFCLLDPSVADLFMAQYAKQVPLNAKKKNRPFKSFKDCFFNYSGTQANANIPSF